MIAEDAGFDGVFCADYITYWSRAGCPTADVWVAPAVATERIRLGMAVTALSRRRPWKPARETAALDRLSQGRVTLAVGLGDAAEPGFAKVAEPADPRVRAARPEESLAILRGLWSGERFSFAGEHDRVDGVAFRPGPVQRPGIPVWVGGGWPRRVVLDRALRHDGICPYTFDPHDPYRDADDEITAVDVAEMRDAVVRERGSADGFDIVLGGRRRRTDRSRRIPELTEAGMTWWMEWIPPGPRGRMRAAVARGPYRVG